MNSEATVVVAYEAVTVSRIKLDRVRKIIRNRTQVESKAVGTQSLGVQDVLLAMRVGDCAYLLGY